MKEPNEQISSGVQDLIERIRNDGVRTGQEQAQTLLENTRQDAAALLADARKQAEQILQNARRAAELETSAGRNAIELAWRDAVLALKEKIAQEFAGRLHNLVRERIDSADVVAGMIAQVLERVTPPAGGLRPSAVQLGDKWATPEDSVVENAISLPVDAAIRALCRDLVEQGLLLEFNGGQGAGFRVRFEGDDVLLDCTDKALANYLLEFLLPRLREYLDGIVH